MSALRVEVEEKDRRPFIANMETISPEPKNSNANQNTVIRTV